MSRSAVTLTPGSRPGNTRRAFCHQLVQRHYDHWRRQMALYAAAARRQPQHGGSARPSTRLLTTLIVWWLCAAATAAAQPPAKPNRFFNDYAGLVSPDVVYELNERLAQAERQTSNQILVVIYPRLPDGEVLEEYTLKAFRAWGVGRAGKDNGIVLFIFLDGGDGHGVDRLEVGRGLEGAVPDATAKWLLAEVLNPDLKRKAYELGMRSIVSQLLQLTAYEFSGDGRTQAETNQADRFSEEDGEGPDAPPQEALDGALRILWPLTLGMLGVMAFWKLLAWCWSAPLGGPERKAPGRPSTGGPGRRGGGGEGFWAGAALGALLSDEGRGGGGLGGSPSGGGDGGSSPTSGFDGGGGTAGGGGASDAF